MRDVYIAGAGMTAFGKFMDTSVRLLAEEATAAALADGGAAPGDVDIAFFANAVGGILTGQEMIRGQVALRHTGVLGVPIVNVENACASASSAFHLAWMAVSSGAAEVALAIGSEKLTHPDKTRSFAAIGTAVDLEELRGAREALSRKLPGAARPDAGSPLPVTTDERPGMGQGPHALEEAGAGTRREDKQPGMGQGPHAPEEAGAGARRENKHSPFMDIYAAMTRHYMSQSGATAADFARVVVKNQGNGKLNPKAQYGADLTVEEVLASREISPPLTLLMCSAVSDGSAALVLCSEEAARHLGAETVKVRSTVLVSGRDRTPGEAGAVERAAQAAYVLAGLGPEDLDVVEVHDAAAPAELIVYEELGLCGPGEGPKLLASGETALGGRVPVNPSGGLLSKGHPIGATGCAQLVELADQLRGRCGARQVEGARVGLAENGGGFLGTDPAAVVITVLSK